MMRSKSSKQGTRSFSRYKFRFAIKSCHSLQTDAKEAQPGYFCCVIASKIKRRISAGRDIQYGDFGLVEVRSTIPWRLVTLRLSAMVTDIGWLVVREKRRGDG